MQHRGVDVMDMYLVDRRREKYFLLGTCTITFPVVSSLKYLRQNKSFLIVLNTLTKVTGEVIYSRFPFGISQRIACLLEPLLTASILSTP